MSRLDDIARKRERLIARAAEQRRAIGESLDGLQGVLSVADRAFALGKWARGNPAVLAIATTGLVALRPKLGLRWVMRALSLWRTGRFALDMLKTLAAMRAARAGQTGGQS